MEQALILSDETIVRMNVIGQRTGDPAVGIVKALMIQTLEEKMKTGVAHFLYMKRNGQVREAFGTLLPSLISKYTNGRGKGRDRYYTTAYFDVEMGTWRSFRWENLIKIY